ncbi:MAG: tetratricopeptide repeat protein, partial [Planctomycetota bacterium]
LCDSLDRPEEALEAYRRAIVLESGMGRDIRLRMRRAQLLYTLGNLKDARQELRVIVRQNPNHRPANRLLKKVVSELVRGSSE